MRFWGTKTSDKVSSKTVFELGYSCSWGVHVDLCIALGYQISNFWCEMPIISRIISIVAIIWGWINILPY
jgi:hypothetical protein